MGVTAGLGGGALEHATLNRPCAGERVSGDATIVVPLSGALLIAIIDVLGHGPEAHDLANEIESYLAVPPSADVVDVMKRLHERFRGSRGAAVGLCVLNLESGGLDYVGTGNTVVRRFGEIDSRLVSQDGVLGQNMRTPRPQQLTLESGDLLVLYTDGVQDRFTAEDYPGVYHHPPKEVVRNLVQRFGKDYDDASVIALRFAS